MLRTRDLAARRVQMRRRDSCIGRGSVLNVITALPVLLAHPSLASTHPTRPVMLLVGLTGNIGSGKSTVAQLLSERGATIIDADVLARRAVEAGTEAHRAIAERWGTSILAADG